MYSEVVDRIAAADDDAIAHRLRELEAKRREVEAETAVVLGELDRRKVYRVDGHASMWGLLRVSVGWSDRECKERMWVARLLERFCDAGEALLDTRASIANVTEIARAHANPRCGDEIEAVIGTLLNEAGRREFDDLKIIVRQWERQADSDGALKDTETNHANRNAHVITWNGVGQAAAQWGELDGLANQEVFDQFVQTEWLADWEATVAVHGDAACKSLMPRTDAQRRADAITRIFQTASSSPPGSRAPEPIVNVHIDHHTFADMMVVAELFPGRNVDPFEPPGGLVTDRRCATDTGHPVDPQTVFQLMVESYIRFVIHDEQGVPIRWGRKRRLFTGAARDAVMSQSCRCTHPGCRVRARRSQADHTTDYSRGGHTDPANGGPRCLRHNLLKNHGYATTRDPRGNWHTYRPDSSEIC